MASAVAIIGSGFIGRGWAIAFARRGFDVRLWDPRADALVTARDYIAAILPDLAQADLLNGRGVDEILARIAAVPTLEEAVDGVVHVQENAPEILDLKSELFTKLDRSTPSDAVIASSTSSLLPSAFTASLEGRARCVVAHPVNPPHLIRLVEVVPAPWTSEETVTRTVGLMQSLGQQPVLVKREIDGFLLNRLQAAILDECFRLVDGGYASAEDIDACIRDGLASRWIFMGPFETIDLNAPAGVRDYVERYQAMFRRMTDTMRSSADWAGRALETIEAERREALPFAHLKDRQIWRDRNLIEVAKFRRDMLDEQDANVK
ncbi:MULTISPECIES: 3-hydroxyacyl-CoA dehydrogenase [unclassified Chelatococcus]|uniref:3-hydroxyacyl-CoA dehydrogenase n=1 Tax=unclassified Chelatococcus TaxID=2638111 RepID=UPI001BCF2375|nr:3-hydroxyacyl-CoA dehydrogenase [Chelatococcus sp.]MBS7700129.1 3-hydroxyacyl-CoA dehydrogenase [Chelatococcus sp. YT9]MBX3556822.1 3-hydroxyacyl-CoA dehydrogenase [Chelatococcus sp.]